MLPQETYGVHPRRFVALSLTNRCNSRCRHCSSGAEGKRGNELPFGDYVKFIRSAPYPLLTTFDSPDFQAVCTARERSNTPLQSLTLANDAALFELAQGLASRLMREVDGTDSAANRERIRRAFLLCLSRPATEPELELLAAYQERQANAFASGKAESIAPADTPAGFAPNEAASWTSVARALMNTDEFITRE